MHGGRGGGGARGGVSGVGDRQGGSRGRGSHVRRGPAELDRRRQEKTSKPWVTQVCLWRLMQRWHPFFGRPIRPVPAERLVFKQGGPAFVHHVRENRFCFSLALPTRFLNSFWMPTATSLPYSSGMWMQLRHLKKTTASTP